MSYKHIFEGRHRVLVISDTQAPFHHPDSLAFLKALKNRIKPTMVVHIGDLTDQNAMSFHLKNPDLYSPRFEMEKADEFMQKLFKLFPQVTILTSNHDARIYRTAEAAGIPTRCLRPLLEILKAPKGWDLVDEITIDGVLYQHGDKGKGGPSAAINQARDNMKSTVIGHYHTNFGIDYFANPDKLIFGMGVGSLIDSSALAFSYAKGSKKKAIIGTGIVLNGMPILVPMMLNSKGRWTGKLKNL
jgi:hypothetical protein